MKKQLQEQLIQNLKARISQLEKQLANTHEEWGADEAVSAAMHEELSLKRDTELALLNDLLFKASEKIVDLSRAYNSLSHQHQELRAASQPPRTIVDMMSK